MVGTYSGSDKRLKYLFDNATEVSAAQVVSSGTPIATVTIDGQTMTVYAPQGGGSNVVVTPLAEDGDDIATISVDGVSHTVKNGIVANPTDAATDDLEKIQIGNAIYNISGGSGSESFVCDTLLDNSALASPTTGITNVERTYTLGESIDDYDAVIVSAWMFVESTSSYNQLMSTFIIKADYYADPTNGDITHTIVGSVGGAYRILSMEFTDDTTLVTTNIRSESACESMVCKVYGLKLRANATNVIANPSGAATDELEKIQIGNTIYGIAGSGSYTCDTLFDNSALDTPESGTSNVERFFTLTNSIDDYDAIIISAWMYVASATVCNQLMSAYIPRENYYVTGNGNLTHLLNGSVGDAYRRLGINITSSTSLTTTNVRSESGRESMLYKVYGVKLRATTINRPVYIASNFSTEEKQIGYWIDNKPLYQKTVQYTVPNATTLGVQVETSVQFTTESLDMAYISDISSQGTIMTPMAVEGDQLVGVRVFVGGDFNIYIQNSFPFWNGAVKYVTVRYTKTNDPASGEGWTPTTLTRVIANPSGTATDDLETVQIGDTIYSVGNSQFSVYGESGDTLGDMLSDLHSSIDYTSVTPKSVLAITTSDDEVLSLQLVSMQSDSLEYGSTSVSVVSGTITETYFSVIISSVQTAVRYVNNSTQTDMTGSLNFSSITLYY